jgi:hypothetical protein
LVNDSEIVGTLPASFCTSTARPIAASGDALSTLTDSVPDAALVSIVRRFEAFSR